MCEIVEFRYKTRSIYGMAKDIEELRKNGKKREKLRKLIKSSNDMSVDDVRVKVSG